MQGKRRKIDTDPEKKGLEKELGHKAFLEAGKTAKQQSQGG